MAVCFNPDLLGGIDNESFGYQVDVDQLTGGNLPAAEEPCVDDNLVPASFILNQLDPTDPQDVFEYVQQRPYFQTRAYFLKTWFSELPPEERLERVTPRLVDPIAWRQDPRRVALLFETSLFSDPTIMSTLTYLMATLPQNDDSLDAILSALGTRRRSGSWFALVHAFGLTTDPGLRLKIAHDLLSQLEYRLISDSDRWSKDPELAALRFELVQEAVPILTWLYDNAQDLEPNIRRWQVKEKSASMLATIGGSGPLEFLTQRAMEGVLESEAVEALLDAARDRQDVIPYLVKLIPAVRDQILERLAKNESLPDSRFLPFASEFLQSGKHISVGSGGSDVGLLNYMASCGTVAIPHLVALVDSKVSVDDGIREDALKALARIDDPKAQEELKKIVFGERQVAKIKYGSLEDEAIEAMVQSNAPAAHEAVLELADQWQKLPATQQGQLFYAMARFDGLNPNGTSDGRTLERFLQKLLSIRDQKAEDFSSHAHVTWAIKDLINRQSNQLPEVIEQLSPSFQVALIQSWFVDEKLTATNIEPPIYLKLADKKGLAPEAKEALEAGLTEFIVGTRDINLIFFALGTQRYPESVKLKVVNKIAARHDIWRALEHIGMGFDIPLSVRKEAVLVWGKTVGADLEKKIEDILVTDYILNGEMPLVLQEAAVDVLRHLAAIPARRAIARRALVSCIPPPPSVISRARKALIETN